MRRLTCLLAACLLALACAFAAAEGAAPEPTPDTRKFAIRFGDRNSPAIALTMDDCYDRKEVRNALELCRKYGVVMTFFPLGDQLKAEDAGLWQEVIDAGCEIGSHTQHHTAMGGMTDSGIRTHIRRFQECLDGVLGYHYKVNSLRPPFGNITDANGSNLFVRRIVMGEGYPHVVLWDVSETDPVKAVKKVQNGSILLYHARPKDVACLDVLIPQLLEMGYKPVTVSELLDFGPYGKLD